MSGMLGVVTQDSRHCTAQRIVVACIGAVGWQG